MNQSLNILIACEESQIECAAWRAVGCNAFSSDVQFCSGGHLDWHILGDCRQLFSTPVRFFTLDHKVHQIDHWDLIIAHPPCTYLTHAGATFLYNGGRIDEDRLQKGRQAADFFLDCLNAQAAHICVENPVPMKIFNLPRPTTYVNPSDYGERYTKRLCYWLKNLPPLMATLEFPNPRSWVYSTRGGKKRSKSFPCVADAMVKQWLPILIADRESNI